MKKWITYMSLFILSACTSNEIVLPVKTDPDGSPPTADEWLIRVSFPDMQQATKAVTSGEECRIDTLQIFIFKDEGDGIVNGTDLYLDRLSVSGQAALRPNPGEYIVKVTVRKPADGIQVRFVLAANIPDEVLTKLKPAVISTEDELRELLKFPAAAWMKPDLDLSSTRSFPMWGTSGFYTGLPGTHIPVEMSRALAKIELGVDINNPAGGDPAIGFGNIFRIDSLWLCNVNDSGYIAPQPNPLNTEKKTIGYKFQPNEGSVMRRTIYAPETDSMIAKKENPQPGDTTHFPPFLILKATYYDEVPYYYRIDFVKDGKYLPLKRNRNYEFNIKGIRTVGYKSFAEASEAPILPLNPKLLLGDETGTAKINEVVYSHTYWLGCQATDVKIDWPAHPAGHPIKIPVGTSYPVGWKATIQSASPEGWLTLESSSGSTQNAEISLSCDNNLTGQPRTATLALTAGTLSQYISLSQSPGSHTYVVQKGNSVSIPLSSADSDGVNRSSFISYIRAETGNNLLSETDNPSSVFTLNVPKDITAENIQLIATKAKGAGADTIYSWSVWVVDENIDFATSTYQRHYNGYTFMNRNLGGGLYYQWGRNAPVTAAVTAAAPVPPGMNEKEAIRHPYTFYTDTLPPYDWMSTGQNNNLWTTIDGEKGPYDPCPFGWRVPPAENDEASPWHGFTEGKNGMTVGSARGLNGMTGQSNPGAAKALVWGASARGAEAYLYDATDGVHRKASRTDAYPIRCIRDVRRSGGSLIVN
ncbi:MAG: hypothetical protein LBS88_13375 [Tannerellaceae bacterium]|jgi:hypothetical protein|nr:hypothetical protein [Tannerellaceae bacterium]